MYRQFIHNIQKKGIAARVFPLPMTSSAAYHLLKQLEIRPDAVYIDAGHEEEEVKLDLEYYYDLLKPNGVLFGDDYSFYWSGVVAAVNKFAAKYELPLWANPEKLTGKFMIQKPNKTELTKY